MEPILTETLDRFVLFPIKYHDIWELYKIALSSIWTVEEIDLTDDINDWNNKLNSNERFFISRILAYFMSSDLIVNENLAAKFLKEVQIPEAKQFYAVQIMVEAIHNETYALLIDTLITNETEKMLLFNAITTIPCIQKKAEWALKWITNSKSFHERLFAFIVVECIFFSGSFCAIFWLKKRGLLPGVCLSNEWISRDEGLHVKFGILLNSKLLHKIDSSVAYEIIKDAVNYEKEFITESLPVSLIGMNCTLMSQYIEYVSDKLLYDLGYDKIYNTQNPFDFIELLSLQGKTNFFEKRVSQYSKAYVSMASKQNDSDIFSTDGEF
jgi:ribonucleoside-diphosphate reductase beta chain